MRTRIFNKMTAREVEEYLARGGNTIFVAVGVIEVHGEMPIDVEQIMPEAYAVVMAEKVDALAMINLPYFFPGGTVVSNATVQVSLKESSEYLMMLGRSLVAQGFRKIIFVSGHGPARMYIDPMCRDFFQETKIHACHINLANLFYLMPKLWDGPDWPEVEYGSAGAYSIMNQKQYLPVDPNAPDPIVFRDEMNPRMYRLQKALGSIGAQTSMIYASPDHHVPNRAFRSVEERDEACRIGEEIIRQTVDKMDLGEMMAALDGYQEYVKEMQEKYPRLKGQY